MSEPAGRKSDVPGSASKGKSNGVSNARLGIILTAIALMIAGHGAYVVPSIVGAQREIFETMIRRHRDLESHPASIRHSEMVRIEALFDVRLSGIQDRLQRLERLLEQIQNP